MTAPATDAAIAAAHLDVLYQRDAAGRLVAVNQWDGGEVPLVHLVRSPAGVLVAARADVPDAALAQLGALLADEALQPGPPWRCAAACLACVGAVVAARGVCLRPPESWPSAGSETVVDVDATNGMVLARHMPDWLPDVGQRTPLVAVLEDGHAVAVGASARVGPLVHEASVEVAPHARRRGVGQAAVLAWAQRVAATGALPLYSADAGNRASLALAARLGYRPWGDELRLT